MTDAIDDGNDGSEDTLGAIDSASPADSSIGANDDDAVDASATEAETSVDGDAVMDSPDAVPDAVPEAVAAGPAGAASEDAPLDAQADADGEPEDEAPGAAPFAVEEWVYGAVESMAFSSAEPLTPRRAKEVLVAELKAVAAEMNAGAPAALPTIQDVKKVFRTLLARWSDPARPLAQGFRLMELDGGITFRSSAASARYVRRVQNERPPRLSRAALETLAVVAYRQPATKPQIEEVRGVDSGGALKALLDKKLIRVIGKADDIGRPLLYGTTKTFLEFFQLSSLSELPTLKELHELENGPSEPVPVDETPQAAVVMDLFNPDRPALISEETEQESAEALDALERALTEAKSVAKKASTVVWGVTIDDDEPRPPGTEAAEAPALADEPPPPAGGEPATDEGKVSGES